MRVVRVRERYILALVFMGLSMVAKAEIDDKPYLCEIGFQGGCGYYVGDAAQHIFMHPREAYGLHFRYKFTQRWAMQVKASGQRITGYDHTMDGKKLTTMWQNNIIGVDAMAEFNFFRFGKANKNDKRVRPYSPYIFLGIGVGIYGAEGYKDANYTKAAAYVPLGIGFKWRFAEQVGLNIAWQHNIYIADNLENRKELDNKYQMNGWNWMNCDLTGMLTVGIVFEFAQPNAPCRICNTESLY